MTKQPDHQLRNPKFTTFEFYRLMDTYVHSGEEAIGRPWRLAAGALRRVIRRVEAGLLGPWSAGQVVTGLAEEYVNLLYGLLTAAPAVVEKVTTRLNNPPPGTMSEYRVQLKARSQRNTGP